MHILNAALDDVGSRSGYVAYAAYIGFSADWGGFTTGWEEVLQQEKLASLHTAEYLHSNPIPEGADPQKFQWELVDPFATVIHKSEVFGICVGVEHAAYNALAPEEKELCGRAEELAFAMFMSAVTKWTHDLDKTDRVTLMVDESNDGSDIRLYSVYKQFKKDNPELGQTLASISFGNDAMYAPIQAADLLGNCFLKTLRNRQRDPHGNLSFNLLTRRLLPVEQRRYAEFVFGAEALRNLVERRRKSPQFLPEFI